MTHFCTIKNNLFHRPYLRPVKRQCKTLFLYNGHTLLSEHHTSVTNRLYIYNTVNHCTNDCRYSIAMSDRQMCSAVHILQIPLMALRTVMLKYFDIQTLLAFSVWIIQPLCYSEDNTNKESSLKMAYKTKCTVAFSPFFQCVQTLHFS